MEKQKRIAAIHDISGIGKCSLTAALPVISAAGVEVAALPTAVLSTHTGDISGYTYRDLTDDMPLVAKHWKELGIEFDGIYSGFLGSHEQVEIVLNFIDSFRKDGSVILVDPAMADSGRMYTTFSKDFVSEMVKLCSKADIIVPNFTEAAFMLGEEFVHPPYTKEYTEALLNRLLTLGADMIVLTGVSFSDDEIGCAVCCKGKEIKYYFSKKYDGTYYGTGDLFASALLGAYMRGKDIFESAEIATDFTCDAICRTYNAKTDTRFGVNFEQGLGDYIRRIER